MFEQQSEPKHSTSPFTRRAFLFAGASVVAGVAVIGESGFLTGLGALSGLSNTIQTKPGMVDIVNFDDNGKRLGVVHVAKVVKSDAEWRHQLAPLSFEVLRQAATERAFTGPLNDNYKKGVYRCLGCDTALFSWQTKYDPKEGWPSFWAPIARRNFVERGDFSLGMDRTEVRCRRCEGHLGHVFDDGPAPTGLRYCMNSASLAFHPQPVAAAGQTP